MHIDNLQKIPPLFEVDVGVDHVQVVTVGGPFEVFVKLSEDAMLRNSCKLHHGIRFNIVSPPKL